MPKMRLKALKKRIDKTGEKTRQRGVENRAKRSKRKKEIQNSQRVTGDTNFSACIDEGGQTGQKVLNSVIVMSWFREGIEEHVDDTTELPSDKDWWTNHQKKLAKKLLEAYGPETVQKAVDYFCKNWERMSEAEGWNGIPTVNILWGWKEQIMECAKDGREWKAASWKKRKKKDKRRADSAEWDDAPMVGVGWK